jgi:two-component system cell cycle sensor histidine kinase/response regulator CckA
MLQLYVSLAYTLFNICLALVIYFKSRRNVTSKFYLFCVTCLVCLGVTGYSLTQPLHGAVRAVLEDTALFLFSLTPFFFLHFVVIFLRRYEILKSKAIIVAVYFAGLFSYAMLLFDLVPRPVLAAGGISLSGYFFYITWMSIFFIIGVALLYSVVGGFSEREGKSRVLLVGFAFLLLLLPGPFTESLFSVLFGQSVAWYFFSSTLALAIAVFLVFRHRVITNTPYQALRSALAAMNDILIKTDEHLNIEMVRGAVTQLLGEPEKELVRRSLLDLVQPRERLASYRDAVLRGATKEGPFDAEVLTKSGQSLPMNFSFTPVFANEELTGFVALARDITERKRAEEDLQKAHDELERRVQERTKDLGIANEALRAEIRERNRMESALRESEEKYRTLFEQSKDVIFFSTPEGQFLDINPAGVELFGYSSKEELMQIDITRDLFCKPADRERYQQALMNEGYVKDYELTLHRKDGQVVTVLESTNIVRDAEERIIAYRGIIRDITEKKQLEQQLIQSQKMESIGTLAGGIAHDFNNILAIVLGYASRLKKGIFPEGQSQPSDGHAKLTQSIDEITKAVKRGARLVQQLLTFARKSDVLFEPVNVNSTAEELIKMLTETFPKTIAFSLKQDSKIPLIVADASQLHQALLNLCVNARDAMPNGGTLTIMTNTVSNREVRQKFPEASADRYISISVADTGLGMDETTRIRIFEPFFTTKELGKGTGLGLAVVYGIVKNHNGFIDVESEIGKSTTFTLYLPVAQRTHHLVEKEEEEGIPGGSETVLVVEDEDSLLRLVKGLLQEKGYQVFTARDGVEAVETYVQHREEIALVFADMGLPILGGWEAFLKMKELNPNVKVVFGSGYLDPNAKSELLKLGAKDFLQKPYTPDTILRRIREVLERT